MSMHALVGTVSMPKEHFAAQQAYLHDELVPKLRDQPGFVAGYWMYDEGAELGRVTLVFSTEAHARRFWRGTADAFRRREELGLSYVDLHLVTVLAHATS
jgi:hypothetical protein